MNVCFKSTKKIRKKKKKKNLNLLIKQKKNQNKTYWKNEFIIKNWAQIIKNKYLINKRHSIYQRIENQNFKLIELIKVKKEASKKVIKY